MNWIRHFLLTFFCTLLFLSVHGQMSDVKEGAQVEILTNDGNVYTGSIVTMSQDLLEIATSNLGMIKINKDDIKRLRSLDPEDQELDSKGYPIDYHNSTHYLINPSGYTLKKGQKYYQNIGIFFNSYSVGVSDRVTVTIGGEIASLLFGGRVPILFISPRYSLPIQSDKAAISVGATFFTSPQDNFVGFGVVQTAFTFGDRNNNFTLGGGIGFSTDGGFESTVAPFYPSFMIRLSDKLSFVSDNFVIAYDNFDGATGVISAALRVHFQKRNGSAIDLGLFRPTDGTGPVIAFPFVSANIAIK